MKRLSGVLVVLIAIAISAGAMLNAPARAIGPLHATTLAPDGELSDVIHDAGPDAVASYQAAIDDPAVLASVPCLCGCIQALGHTSNLACYIESSARGVTVYSTHGLYCLICQRITGDALAGSAAGMQPAELRAMIVDEYGG